MGFWRNIVDWASTKDLPTVELRTRRNGDTVHIDCTGGDPEPHLPRNSHRHRLKFKLVDDTGLNVRFFSLDREDCTSTCPPAAGNHSDQIVGDVIGDREASFTDKNNNKRVDMPVTYQWNFTCDDPSVTVEPFDPTITNGGRD